MTILKTPSLIAAASCLLLGCGDGQPTSPRASVLDGSWSRLDEVPGSSEHWTLSVTDTIVTGTGTWSGEACCSGPLSLLGYVSHDSLHADVTLTIQVGVPRPPLLEHVDLALQSPTTLIGTGEFSGSPAQPVRMQRDP
jgi:hypothetical protein